MTETNIQHEKPPNIEHRQFLNVGGNSKRIPVPAAYDGWQHVLLDIDAKGQPDIHLDARHLTTLDPGRFDSVYCSHNLEHYYPHDVQVVLSGFLHILKDDGFAHIRVPDLTAVMKLVVERDLDIEDTLYTAPIGPVTARDVIYGYAKQIETTGDDFFAHKTGFTMKSLRTALHSAGFGQLFIGHGKLELKAYAFKANASEYYKSLLHLPDQ